MYYADVIWNLYHQQKKRVREIVKIINNPLITQEFVVTVIKNNRRLRKYPVKTTQWPQPLTEIDFKVRTESNKRRISGRHYRPRRMKKDLW